MDIQWRFPRKLCKGYFPAIAMLVDRRVSIIQWAWWNSSWISCCFSLYHGLAIHHCEQWSKPCLDVIYCGLHHQVIYTGYISYGDYNELFYGSLWTNQYDGMSERRTFWQAAGLRHVQREQHVWASVTSRKWILIRLPLHDAGPEK